MKQKLKTLGYAGISIFLFFSLIRFPDQALEAAIRGLNMWWEVVFPSLLPFFITAELLLAFGVVKFLGVLFEPIMRPLFNIPGAGSFGWIMGMASGYPTGAKIASRLREERQLSQIEAERLVSFTNNSSPLFIFGAISAGFFYNIKLGLLLAVCHYGANTIVGIVMRFHGRKQEQQVIKKKKYSFSLKKAFQEMHRNRLRNTRPFGEILGDAVLNSIQTLVMIGGFIILFSVLIKLLFLMDITPFLATLIEPFLPIFELPKELGLPFISGLFEITVGSNLISQVATDSLLQKAMLISFILGFNGLSIQAQVASILAKTDIRFYPYFLARLLHGTFAVILTILLYKPLYLDRIVIRSNEIPAATVQDTSIWMNTYYLLQDIGPAVTIISLATAVFIIIYKNKINNPL
ncbi:sporulation integral membrane protein YlbJ [Oceanobacillus jeddahense]|uniref:Sporulation integral membrane protein YlbJ n=1 Tax=Oceanobacillus jeddahense TaxID=1462527 RepID=A0ABY5JR45_9BACI|nr:sporulation integral membrane protein YlbJ [Oceanobacillus jeddahense]UUI01643.1 sporulation integral membrane protein YlbJ [Oceanobacillus jeddahense]